MIYSFRFWAPHQEPSILYFSVAGSWHLVEAHSVKWCLRSLWRQIFVFDSLMYPKGLLQCWAHNRFWLNFCCEVSSLILCRNLRFRTSQYVLIIVKSIYIFINSGPQNAFHRASQNSLSWDSEIHQPGAFSATARVTLTLLTCWEMWPFQRTSSKWLFSAATSNIQCFSHSRYWWSGSQLSWSS